jgi:hypothetical protein
MRNTIQIFEPDVINNQNIEPYINSSKIFSNYPAENHVPEILRAEGCEDFLTYTDWLGLARDPDLIVLSSMHHYYYDAEEMKNVKSVINLKELNHVKDLKGFLHSIFHILPKKSYFIGCFVDNKKNSGFELRKSDSSQKNKMNSEAIENGILSRIPFLNMLFSLMDSRTNNYLSRTSVSLLIEGHGFKILDMTELNGLTYFCAQRIQTLLPS